MFRSPLAIPFLRLQKHFIIACVCVSAEEGSGYLRPWPHFKRSQANKLYFPSKQNRVHVKWGPSKGDPGKKQVGEERDAVQKVTRDGCAF